MAGEQADAISMIIPVLYDHWDCLAGSVKAIRDWRGLSRGTIFTRVGENQWDRVVPTHKTSRWPAWPVGRLAMTYNEPAMTVEWVRNDVERARDDGMRSLW